MSRKRSRSRSRGSSQSFITRRRILGVLTVGGVGAAGLQATGAFDVINAQRDLDVATTDDGKAFLAVKTEDVSGFDGDTVTLLKLTNQFEQPLTSISATVISSGNPIDPQTLQTPAGLAQGESAPVQATLDCNTDGTVEVQIVATSANQRVQLRRPVQVTCKSFNVCAPKNLPSGCVLNKIPKGRNKQTDCSVKIDTSNQIDNTIAGNTEIGGAAEFLSQSQVKLRLRGNATVQEYLKIDTPSQVDLSMKGNSVVQNGLKLKTESQLDLDMSTEVNKGLCIDKAGKVTFSSQGGTVDGAISITSTDQVTMKKFQNAETGQITIDASGQVDFGDTQNADISGDIDITASGQVTFSKFNDVSTESLTIDASGQVKLEETENTVISGGIDIDAPDQVTLDTLTDVSAEAIDIDADGQVDIITERSTITGDITVPSAGGQITFDFADTEITGGISSKNNSQVKVTLTNESTVGKSLDIDTNSQVTITLKNSSITDNITIDTPSQVTIKLTNSSIDGTVTIESQSQVDVTLNNSSIQGDLNITTSSEITISDCSAVEGEVTPRRACS